MVWPFGRQSVTKSVFTTRYERFRKLLVRARRMRGFTQAQLARSLGRPQSFVSKYERGERRLDVIEFIEITKAIGADPVEILRDTVR